MPIHLHLFGRPRLAHDGAVTDLPFERRHQLLAYLAARRAWAGRPEVAAMFWPEQPARLAQANLRKTLFRAQSVPWPCPIESQRNALRVEAGSDLAEFDAALRAGRLDEAVQLGEGEFLEGFDDAASPEWGAWLAFERNRLRNLWQRAALECMGRATDAAQVQALAARLLRADPLDEEAVQAHMEWLARNGQLASARRVYRGHAQALQAEHGISPGADLQRAYAALGLVPDGGATSRNAAPEDGFVGRSLELRAISDLLSRAGCRLVTLVGPGGAGKTRLARRVAHEHAGAHADGAAFVELEAVATPQDLPAAMVRQLKIGGEGGELQARLATYLQGRDMLLVLDNFEHLLGGTAWLHELVTASPGLRVLVTSRERLGTALEHVVAVNGLPCPDAEDADHLESFDAAQLFVGTARRVDPAFLAAEPAAIIEICHHVDGLPLALELAASWTRVLSCAAIAAELRRGTELLRSADPARPARHASMDTVFAQTWARLPPAERDGLARLTVFHGSFAPEAARAVTGASLPVLAALVDKSLLRKDGGRLLLHPVIEQLAARQLQGEPRGATEAAHAQYFGAMLAQLRRSTEFGDRATLASLDLEQDNWHAAWHWLARHGAQGALVQATPTLRAYSDHRGRSLEARALAAAALEHNPQPEDPRFVPVLLGAVAHFDQRLDRFDLAMEEAHQALAAVRPGTGDEPRLRCLNTLGACCMRQSRNAEARRHYRAALKLADRLDNPRYGAVLLQNLSQIEKREDRVEDAMALLAQSLARYRQIGDHASEALSLYQLGLMEGELGDTERAALHSREALVLCEQHGLRRTHGYVLSALADFELRAGRLAQAQVHAQQGLDLAVESGARLLEAWLRIHRARIALLQDDVALAREELARAAGLAIDAGTPVTQVYVAICFGELLAATGASPAAARVLAFAASHPAASIAERRQVEGIHAQWRLAPAAGSGLPLLLPELCRRIAGEAAVQHAPLVAALQQA